MKKRATHILFILCLFISQAFIAHSQDVSSTHKAAFFADPDRFERVASTSDTVDVLFENYAKSHHMPGLSYGIVLDGNLVYSNSFGFANLEKKYEVNTNTLFRIASMSKSFTAVAILQLRDAGKLNLDDPIIQYLPEAENLAYLTKDAPDITIRHLLTHGAGFPEDNPWGDRQLADSDEELMQMIEEGVSFSNVAGINYEYSNVGFALLGQIVQRVSGMSYQDYTQTHIFEPLGMKSTVWEYENAPAGKLAFGYEWIDQQHKHIPHEHHGAYGAMGGLITSINDFVQYVAMHLSAWPPRDEIDDAPLKRSSLREMHHPWRFNGLDTEYHYDDGRPCPTVSAYAYGLRWSQDCDKKTYVGHSGGLPGFGSNWVFMPDYGLAVMSFDNRTYGSTSRINMNVIDTIIKLSKLEPRTLPASDILRKRMSQLVNILPSWTDAESSGIFADNFFMDNRLKDLVQQSTELFEAAGKIRKVDSVKAMNQLRGTFIMEGENANIEIFFTLNPEKEALIQKVKMRILDKHE